MATTSKRKWEKYFANREVETHVKPKSGRPIYLYDEGGNRCGLAEDGDAITVFGGESYSPQYRIKRHRDGFTGTICEQFVSKPRSTGPGPSEVLRLNSASLAGQGLSISMESLGNAEFKSFSSANDVISSVRENLAGNWRVPQEVKDQVKEYDPSSRHIHWKNIPDSTRNELGKYLGEIFVGSLALSGTGDAFSDGFITKPTEEFGVPVDTSFSGIDSFIRTGSNTVFVSSKFGPGARSSVFSNILPEALRKYDEIGNCELRLVLDSAWEAGISDSILESKRGSKEILYTYGINKLLGMNSKSPMNIFNNIRSNVLEGKDLSSESIEVLNEIADRAEEIVKDKLPGSATQFFSRSAAFRLNSDPESIESMKQILALKDFVQLNLNMNLWRQGTIFYQVKKSSECNIKIMGNKAAIGDIDGRQGLLSYELR